MGATLTPVRRVAGLLCVAVVLCAGCKVDARVDVTLHADGSGTVTARVTLDHDAVAELTRYAPLARAVPLGDVRAAGWTVSGWKTSGGAATVTLSHDFAGQAQLSRLLADLAGPSGVLRGARITHSRGWFDAKDTIGVTGDLRHLSTGVKGDAQLRSKLDRAFTLTIAVHAPDGQTNAVSLHAGDQATVTASSSRQHTTRAVLVIVGAGLLVLALVVTAGLLIATWRRRRASSASARS